MTCAIAVTEEEDLGGKRFAGCGYEHVRRHLGSECVGGGGGGWIRFDGAGRW